MASERRATTATSGEPLPPYLPSLLCDLHAPEDDGYGTTFQRGSASSAWCYFGVPKRSHTSVGGGNQCQIEEVEHRRSQGPATLGSWPGSHGTTEAGGEREVRTQGRRPVHGGRRRGRWRGPD
ncbi:hypothetical protein SORBI_3009G253450 [Sorghum bicolor]|uniref:Uncharacterized protein n=1 Tax=Sorghum bicolor TaxID=4558 RepID=A0A1Z5R425_SORBI|nr:hypothetical protein SORBI_3009G253450 [Sorghum bicolor]